jgi:hypothetical protein
VHPAPGAPIALRIRREDRLGPSSPTARIAAAGGVVMKKTSMIMIASTLALACSGPVFAQPVPRRTPQNMFQFRLGGFFPSGGGDFWRESEQVFTLDTSDFQGFIFGMSYVADLNNYIDLGVNVDFYGQTVTSSYRAWADQNGIPFLHDSELTEVPLTVDVRFLPIGRFAERGKRGQYKVARPVPYLGLGIGMNFWEYEETGDFLDFTYEPPVPFLASFHDDGVAFEWHALAGVEIPLSPFGSLLFEGRYSWCKATLSQDFSGLGDIDLGGGSIYGGFGFRF